MMGKLVVVTVVKNCASLLEETCESFATQSHRPWHLFIDGGSHDGTAELAERWSARLGGGFVSSEDRGPYDAMNRAIEMLYAEDRVWFMNAGDLLTYADAVADVDFWTKDDAFVWGYGAVDILSQDGERVSTVGARPYSVHSHALGKVPICHQTVVARVGSIRASGGFDETFSLAADYKLLLALGAHAQPRVWPRVIAAYRAGGLSDRNLPETARQQAAISMKALNRNPGDVAALRLHHAMRMTRIYGARILYRLAPGVDWHQLWRGMRHLSPVRNQS